MVIYIYIYIRYTGIIIDMVIHYIFKYTILYLVDMFTVLLSQPHLNSIVSIDMYI